MQLEVLFVLFLLLTKAVSKDLTLEAFMFDICVRVYFVLYLNLYLG